MRKATLQTLETLTADDSDRSEDKKTRWGEGGGIVLQEALRHVFQCVLVEHITAIQDVAERVWENLVVKSDLELLLHAACPHISTWLCLAMQPEHVPFNPNLLMIVTSNISKGAKNNQTVTNCDGQSDTGSNGGNVNTTKTLSELKMYIGGIETVALNVRKANVVQARCRASRMLGLLSHYVVQPAPGVIYPADVPSPAVCYAKVLLAHLNSRSALQRTVVGFTMSHWATVAPMGPPVVPDILRYEYTISVKRKILLLYINNEIFFLKRQTIGLFKRVCVLRRNCGFFYSTIARKSRLYRDSEVL